MTVGKCLGFEGGFANRTRAGRRLALPRRAWPCNNSAPSALCSCSGVYLSIGTPPSPLEPLLVVPLPSIMKLRPVAERVPALGEVLSAARCLANDQRG